MKTTAPSRPGFLDRFRRSLLAREQAAESSARRSRRSIVEPLEARIAPAAVIGATTTKTFFVDADGDGQADPGLDTIQYVVTISNTGDANATNVSYNDNLDPNTLLSGAVLRSPLAVAQSFNAVGNTALSVNGVGGLKTNVHDLDSVTADGGLTVTAGTFATSAGGSVTIAADGSFTYSPETGDQNLTDTFTYSVTDSDGLAGTGRASINLGARVWYVDSTNSGVEDGSSAKPYNSLSDITGASGSDTTGDVIFVKNAGAAYDGNLTLLNSQHLYGSGATLIVNGITLNTAGTKTSLTTTVGTTNTLTLASGNDVHGFTFGNSAVGATGTAISGTNFGTLTVDSTTINTTGVALNLNTGTFAGSGLTSTTGKSVLLTGVAGTVALGSGALNHNAGDIFVVAGGTATVSYSGKITAASGAGHSVSISNKTTSGDVTLSGRISDSGTGILLDNNDGATVTLKSVTASTGANTAFSAINGGTVVVTNGLTDGIDNDGDSSTDEADEANTLTTTTGTATNIVGTTIGAGGVTFKSISSNGGTAAGIILTNTGSTGFFTVTGDGTAANNNSGGSIINKSSAGDGTDGIALTNAPNVTLNQMLIQDNGRNGIFATGNMNGLTISRSNINSNADQASHSATPIDESGVYLYEATGTVNITNTNITNSFETDLRIENSSGSITANITNSTISNNGASGQAQNLFNFLGTGTANMTLNVVGSTFTGNQVSGALTSDGIHADTGGGVMDVEVSTSNFSNNFASISLTSGGNAATKTLAFDIHDNASILNSVSSAIIVFANANSLSTDSISGKIRNNVIGTLGSDKSGSLTGRGIDIGNEGAIATTLSITGNTINETYADSIFFIQNVNATNAQTSNLTVSGNTLRNFHTLPNPSNAFGISVNLTTTGTVHANISGNTLSDTTNTIITNKIRVRQTGGGTFRLTQADENTVGTANGLSGAGEVDALGTINYNQGVPPVPLFFAPAPPASDKGMTPPVEPPPTVIVTLPPVETAQAPVIVDDGVLSQAELDSLVDAAIARWEASGLTPEQSAVLHSITFSVADMSGWYLGQATPGHVALDADAAGNAWFVDATPDEDSEFSGSGTQLSAPIGVASGRVDALTTVMHEIGHQLGLDDTYATTGSSSLMYGFMHLGERRLPAAHQAEGADPHHLSAEAGPDFAIGPVGIGTLNAGSSVQVLYRATVNSPFPGSGTPAITDQGTVSFDPAQTVQTNSVSTTVDLPLVNVAVSSAVAENSGADLIYTFTRTGDLNVPLTVQFQASGAATFSSSGQDYTISDAASFSAATGLGTVTFAGAPGAPVSTVTLHVHVTGDNTVEADESVILTVNSGQNGYNPGATPAVTGTISNDDAATVSLSGGSVLEGASGPVNLPFTVQLSNPVDVDVTVLFSTADGSAKIVDSDYVAQSGQLVTIPAGQTSVTKNVVVNGDQKVEIDETVAGSIGTLSTGGRNVSLGTTTANATITNDDSATLSISGGSVTEGHTGSTANLPFTFSLDHPVDVDVTVQFSTGNGSATAPGDYTTQTNQTVTILAGQLSATKDVTVNGDDAVEANETVVGSMATIGNSGRGVSLNSTTASNGTINDDDANVSVAVSAPVNEDGTTNLVYTFTRTGDTTGPLTVGFTASGSATIADNDYTILTPADVTFTPGTLTGTVTFAAGANTATVTVDPTSDLNGEADETVILALPASGLGYTSFNPTSASGTILNDDTQVTLALDTPSIAENAAPGVLTYTFTRVNGDLASPLTINFTKGGNATVVTDYTVTGSAGSSFDYANGTITIPIGSTSATVTFAPVDDLVVEADETSQFTLAAGVGYAVSTAGPVTATILDNDTATLSIAKVNDGAETNTPTPGKFRVTQSLASDTDTVISYTIGGTATPGAGNDYTALTGTVTILAGQTTADIDVTVLNDSLVEATETVSATLSGISGGDAQISIGGTDFATLDITDDDVATLSITKINDGTEGGGTGKFRITQSVISAVDTTVSFTLGGTAISGTDYTAPTLTRTILAGQTTVDIDLATLNDTLVEGTETVSATLGTVTSGAPGVSVGATNNASLDLLDNDTATLSISSATGVTEQGGSQFVTVTLVTSDGAGGTATLAPGISLSADVIDAGGGTAASGTDYTAFGTRTVTFTTGDGNGTAKIVNLAVLNDSILENSETVNLHLQNLGTTLDGQASLGTVDNVTTIADNETATLSIVSTATITEQGGAQNLTVTLNVVGDAGGTAQLGAGVTLTGDVVDAGGGTALSGTDYSAFGTQTVTFTGGTLTGATQNVVLAPVNDSLIEGSEQVNLKLQNPLPAFGGRVTLGGTTSAVTITDNDNGDVTIAKINDGTEGAGNGKFRITQSGISTTDTVVNYTIGGAAVSGSDFTPLTGTATITAGNTSVDLDIALLNDTVVEGTETVTATLTGFGAHDPAITLGGTTGASLDIIDNDTAVIHFVSDSSSTAEGAGSSNIAVQLDITANGVPGTGTLGQAVEVTLSDLHSGGASVGLDYDELGLLAPATFTFAAGAASGSKSLAVGIKDDAIVEASESVNLGLGALVDGTNGQVTLSGIQTHTLTIDDNDSATVTIAKVTDGAEGAVPTPGKFRVTQSAVSSTDTVISYTVGGSATPGASTDYVALSGTVTIPAGQTTADIAVTVLDDSIVESSETVAATLTNVTGDPQITLDATKTASLDITNNDVATVSITKIDDGAESNAPAAGKFRVTQSLASSVDTVVSYSIAGRATPGAGNDYATLSGSVMIPAGQTTADIDVTVLNDDISEAVETVNVVLTGITGGNSGISVNSSAKTASLNITDSDIDLQVTKTESTSTVVAGTGPENLVYTITVKNTGEVDATNIVIGEDLTLPAGVTLQSAVPSSGSFAPTINPDGTWTIASLAKGASETLTVTLTADHTAAAGTDVISNTASVISASEDLVDTGDDSATESTSVARESAVSITKTGTPQLVQRGKEITYTITVSNNGPSDTTGAKVTDIFPAELTGATFTVAGTGGASGFAAGMGNLSQSLDLPAGSTVTYIVTGTAPVHPASPTIINTATVVAADDTTTGDDSAEVTTSIYQGIYVTAPGIAAGNKYGPPKVQVFNPATGTQITSFFAYEPNYKDSVRVAVGDINDDGFDDIITTTAKGTGRLRVFLYDPVTSTFAQPTNGPFSAELAIFDGKKDKGAFVASGDLNGDGQDDIAVGSALGGGKVKVIDGLTGTPVTFASTSTNFFQPFGKTFRGGVRVATGDTDGDGKDELVVGQGLYGAGVKVYAGKADFTTIDQTKLQDFTIKNGTRIYRGGVSVATGDLDHDGKADLIIGRNSGKPTQIEVFRGLDLAPLGMPILPFDVNPAKPKYLNGVRVAAVDVNFDGVADIIAGAGGRAGSRVNIYDGVTHLLLRSQVAYPNFLTQAIFVAGSSAIP